jgi:hypothetical protein
MLTSHLHNGLGPVYPDWTHPQEQAVVATQGVQLPSALGMRGRSGSGREVRPKRLCVPPLNPTQQLRCLGSKATLTALRSLLPSMDAGICNSSSESASLRRFATLPLASLHSWQPAG